MIKNEKQYKITKLQFQTLQKALNIVDEVPDQNIHPLLIKAQNDAVKSQCDELFHQIEVYEALREGKFNQLELESFELLPQGLIKARIARGLSQKDLAEKLGLKEQQIQRYEATDYATASFERLKQIINALQVKVREDIFLSDTFFNETIFIRNLSKVGISKEFLLKKIIPDNLISKWENISELAENEANNLLHKIGEITAKIFKVETDQLFRSDNFKLSVEGIHSVRYKKSISANTEKVSAYTLYAHVLALNIYHCVNNQIQSNIPNDPKVIRSQLLKVYGKIDFESLIDYLWNLGIPVIALNDPGAFHGACWRIDGFNIIALKQKTMSEARWIFDAIHELCHAGQHPEQLTLDIIETGEFSKDILANEDELEANYFAADVFLGENADKMVNECIIQANNAVEKLKKVVPQIASKYDVDLGGLANHISFRLAKEKGISWWGTAINLQTLGFYPWEICRKHILKNCNLNKLNDFDRELLIKAMV